MNVEETANGELAVYLIDKFMDLQRILKAEDKEKEIQYQIRVTKAKLEELGVVTENLLLE